MSITLTALTNLSSTASLSPVLASSLSSSSLSAASGTGFASATPIGPTCGLPSQVVTLMGTLLGWEKGFLVLALVLGAFACLIAMVVGRAANWRHVSEAASIGLVSIIAIAVIACVITGVLALLLANFSC